MSAIRFLHASDIHFGAFQFTYPELSLDYVRSFQFLLEYAQNKSVDFVILGGDVFTSIDILPGLFTEICNCLQNFYQQTHNQIPIIAIEGNHDLRRYSHGVQFQRGQSWLKVLSSLNLITLLLSEFDNQNFLFNPYDDRLKTGNIIEIKDTTIIGTHYLGEKIGVSLKSWFENLPESNTPFTILLQHFGIQGEMVGVPGEIYSEINWLRAKVDYLGLGHFHKGFTIHNWIFNPGCLIPVSFHERLFDFGFFDVNFKKVDHQTIVDAQRVKPPTRKYIKMQITIKKFAKTFPSFIVELKNLVNNSINSQIPDLNHFQKPLIYLVLSGIKPGFTLTKSRKKIVQILNSEYPVIFMGIQFKFTKSTANLEKFL